MKRCYVRHGFGGSLALYYMVLADFISLTAGHVQNKDLLFALSEFYDAR